MREKRDLEKRDRKNFTGTTRGYGTRCSRESYREALVARYIFISTSSTDRMDFAASPSC